jgi:hypothetical protein
MLLILVNRSDLWPALIIPKSGCLSKPELIMKKFRGMMYFLAGVVFTLAVMFSFFSTQDAGAASACIRTGLTAIGAVGDVPDSNRIKIGYSFSKCLLSAGYKAEKVWKENDDHLRVVYRKVDN